MPWSTLAWPCLTLIMARRMPTPIPRALQSQARAITAHVLLIQATPCPRNRCTYIEKVRNERIRPMKTRPTPRRFRQNRNPRKRPLRCTILPTPTPTLSRYQATTYEHLRVTWRAWIARVAMREASHFDPILTHFARLQRTDGGRKRVMPTTHQPAQADERALRSVVHWRPGCRWGLLGS